MSCMGGGATRGSLFLAFSRRIQPPTHTSSSHRTPLTTSYACNNSGAQKFTLVRGNQQVKVAGTNFCLDAGTNPADGSKIKIW